VQHRYVGDIGDFVTYGLLRVLSATGVGRLGVIWYLVADETHNADGRHVTYLDAANRIGRQLRECDPGLYAALRTLVEAGQRDVASVARSRVLPHGTRYYAAPLRRVHAHPSQRDAWFRRALRATADCDTVFLDPDNGIACGPRPVPGKYAKLDEVAALAGRGQSLVVYQHADRSTSVDQQATRLLQRLADAALPVAPLAAVVARRGTVRMFALIPRASHHGAFAAALALIESSPWSTHLQPVYHLPAAARADRHGGVVEIGAGPLASRARVSRGTVTPTAGSSERVDELPQLLDRVDPGLGGADGGVRDGGEVAADAGHRQLSR
jgi:hypothetical protein